MHSINRDANLAFGHWNLAELGCVANISEEHTNSIIRAEVRRAVNVGGLYRDRHGSGHGDWPLTAMG
jgi:hypothetical protein